MFRQDRTNPSTAVSTWKARKDLPKANPSTAVSAWMNGGLAGGGAFSAYGGIITQYEDSGTTYRVHAFRGSGSFTVSAGSADCDLLIVAGGGGPGVAGGGAGGIRHKTGVTVEAASSPYTITVGTGGSGLIWSGTPQATDGTNTSALGFTTTGGGIGGSYTGSSYNIGGTGGSGGGTNYSGSGASGNAGSYTPVEGYDGSVNGGGGGGGGAASGNDGGIGLASMIGISATTRTYAGGGDYKTNGTGTGGYAGGGGQGGYDAGDGGTPNTGGGAGGKTIGSAVGGAGTPSTGASGIVLIRYVVA